MPTVKPYEDSLENQRARGGGCVKLRARLVIAKWRRDGGNMIPWRDDTSIQSSISV